MSEAADISVRHLAIRKNRISAAARSLALCLGVAQLLFASFAVGTAFGPAPLRPLELVLGFALTIIFGASAWPLLLRTRLEHGARLVSVLREGRRTTRTVVFDDHFVLGPEIVLCDSIVSAELDGSVLVLRYKDPRYEGVVLRELSGPSDVLRMMASALKSQAT
jgi:hypothetical protein